MPPRKLRANPASTARQRDIRGKPSVHRIAVAEGILRLRPRSLRALRNGTVEKGDPLSAGSLAGLSAMKRTSDLIPHCHMVPLTGSEVTLRRVAGGVRARARAETHWGTGVEMEALVGVSVALLTVWDMVKYLEKDEGGGYPHTSLGPVKVLSKWKSPEVVSP